MSRRHRYFSCLVALVVIAGTALPLCKAEWLVRSMRDDAFYYAQIARNIATGAGVTFDGIHRTNGFHPAWLVCLVPVFCVFPGDFEPLFAILAMQIALVCIAAMMIFRTLLRQGLGVSAALFGALWLLAEPGSFQALRQGMESALYLVALVFVWQRWLALNNGGQGKASEGRRRDAWMLGVACAFAFFSRLEGFLVAPAVLLVGRRAFQRRPAFAFAVASPTLIGAVIYATWNRVAFGVWSPISGMIEAHYVRATDGWRNEIADISWTGHAFFANVSGSRYWSDWSRGTQIAYVLLTALVAAAAWRFKKSLVEGIRQSGISVILVAAAMIAVADVVVIGGVSVWNNVPLLLSSSLVGAVVIARTEKLAPFLAGAVVLAVLARVPKEYAYLSSSVPNEVEDSQRVGQWLRENTKIGERIGSWNAGAIGYFAHRSVINLDGLVNDAEFFREGILKKEVGPYVRREKIVWLADLVKDPPNFFGDLDVPDLAPHFDLAANFPSDRPRLQVFRIAPWTF